MQPDKELQLSKQVGQPLMHHGMGSPMIQENGKTIVRRTWKQSWPVVYGRETQMIHWLLRTQICNGTAQLGQIVSVICHIIVPHVCASFMDAELNHAQDVTRN